VRQGRLCGLYVACRLHSTRSSLCKYITDVPLFYTLFLYEESGKLIPMFAAKPMSSIMKTRHLVWKNHYPGQGQNRDFPLKNIENARPETLEASKPRIDPKKVPFDPREAIMQVPEWDICPSNQG